MTPTQTMQEFRGQITQNHHTFASMKFDPPNVNNSMAPWIKKQNEERVDGGYFLMLFLFLSQ